jgi:hypothetical protein
MPNLIPKEETIKQLNEDDPIWHVQLTILAVIILQISLPDRFSVGPRYVLPFLEVVLLALLSSTTKRTAVVKSIYLTNIVIFALLYWELDGGGRLKRTIQNPKNRDFVFAQMTMQEFVSPNWRPSFVDYLALSGTNALAFSPTDTMPITRRAKLLMLVQAFVALATLGLIAARAVNILN